MPKMYAASPKSFIEKLFFSEVLEASSIGMSFAINNMSSTYKIRNTTELSLAFL
jgi:hypothetical protein